MTLISISKKVKPHVKLYEEEMYERDYVGIKNDKIYKLSTKVKYHFNLESGGEDQYIEFQPEDVNRIYGIVSIKYNPEEQSNIVPVNVINIKAEESNV